jgi:hypothetical protein
MVLLDIWFGSIFSQYVTYLFIFLVLSLILLPYPASLFFLPIWLCGFLRIFSIEDYVICEWRQFFFFFWDHYIVGFCWLECSEWWLSAVMRNDILAMFLSLGENLWLFTTSFLMMCFTWLRKFLVFLIFWEGF